MIRSTHTYAILEVSHAAYQEIKDKLAAAGYSDQFHDSGEDGIVIDMHGIALATKGEKPMEEQLWEVIGLPDGDVVYLRAPNLTEAYNKLKEKLGDIPRSLLEFGEIDELPEGAELL